MHCIIDRNIALPKKAIISAHVLAELHHDNLYVVPAVRNFIAEAGRGPRPGATVTAASDTDAEL